MQFLIIIINYFNLLIFLVSFYPYLLFIFLIKLFVLDFFTFISINLNSKVKFFTFQAIFYLDFKLILQKLIFSKHLATTLISYFNQ